MILVKTVIKNALRIDWVITITKVLTNLENKNITCKLYYNNITCSLYNNITYSLYNNNAGII